MAEWLVERGGRDGSKRGKSVKGRRKRMGERGEREMG